MEQEYFEGKEDEPYMVVTKLYWLGKEPAPLEDMDRFLRSTRIKPGAEPVLTEEPRNIHRPRKNLPYFRWPPFAERLFYEAVEGLLEESIEGIWMEDDGLLSLQFIPKIFIRE